MLHCPGRSSSKGRFAASFGNSVLAVGHSFKSWLSRLGLAERQALVVR